MRLNRISRMDCTCHCSATKQSWCGRKRYWCLCWNLLYLSVFDMSYRRRSISPMYWNEFYLKKHNQELYRVQNVRSQHSGDVNFRGLRCASGWLIDSKTFYQDQTWRPFLRWCLAKTRSNRQCIIYLRPQMIVRNHSHPTWFSFLWYPSFELGTCSLCIWVHYSISEELLKLQSAECYHLTNLIPSLGRQCSLLIDLLLAHCSSKRNWI